MAARRRREVRERLSATLERVTLVGSHYTHKLLFTGELCVECPRCQKLFAILSSTIMLELACGCIWHPPDRLRDKEGAGWVSFSREEIKIKKPKRRLPTPKV